MSPAHKWFHIILWAVILYYTLAIMFYMVALAFVIGWLIWQVTVGRMRSRRRRAFDRVRFGSRSDVGDLEIYRRMLTSRDPLVRESDRRWARRQISRIGDSVIGSTIGPAPRPSRGALHLV